MATFECQNRRMPKIEACLKANGLESLGRLQRDAAGQGHRLRQDHPRHPAHLLR